LGASAEKLVVQGNIPSATTIKLRPTKTHTSGAFLILCGQWSSIVVMAPTTNKGTIYLFAWPRAFTVLDSYGRGSLQPTASGGAPGTGSPLLLGTAIPGGQWSSSEIYGAFPIPSEFVFVVGTASDAYSVVLSAP
jgi:hypothetical protein